MYYTYAYLREDGTPYYIGKGSGSRAFRKRSYIKRPSKDRILFLKEDLTEEEAFKHEMYMIALYGRKSDGGILHNLTVGGEGTSGTKWSPEQHFAHRERMMGNTYGKGKVTSEETKRKISEAKRGKKWSPERRLERSISMTGKFKPDNQVSKHALYMREWSRRKLAQGD